MENNSKCKSIEIGPKASHQNPDCKVSSSMHIYIFLGTTSALPVAPTNGA